MFASRKLTSCISVVGAVPSRGWVRFSSLAPDLSAETAEDIGVAALSRPAALLRSASDIS